MTNQWGQMEVVVAVTISVLGTVFLASLIGLIVVCKQRLCKRPDLITMQHRVNEPDQNLVENMEGPQENPSGVELGDVGYNAQNLELILQNEEWVNDATGLAPHCLDILKTCHMLTERLVGMTMGNQNELSSPETLTDLVATAKRIGPRVDEVVKSLYPPLDPRLLEARCTALVLSVSHLVLVTKNACRLSGVLDWIDQSLADVEDHLRVLREASINFESHHPRSPPTNEQQPQQNQPSNQNSPSHGSPNRNEEARV